MDQEPKQIEKQFVVLYHESPPGHDRSNHWDLMFEQDNTLATWALDEMLQPGVSIEAIKLAPHRLDYLQYEGPVSGDRGSVSRVLEGTYRWKPGCDGQVALLDVDAETWQVELQQRSDAATVVTVELIK